MMAGRSTNRRTPRRTCPAGTQTASVSWCEFTGSARAVESGSQAEGRLVGRTRTPLGQGFRQQINSRSDSAWRGRRYARDARLKKESQMKKFKKFKVAGLILIA